MLDFAAWQRSPTGGNGSFPVDPAHFDASMRAFLDQKTGPGFHYM